MDTDRERTEIAIVPAEQDTVPFYGRSLVAVRLEDGRICAVLRWLCEGLSMDANAQVRRIRRKTALADGLLMIRIQTDGGPQAMPALTINALPGWLFGIDENRVRPEARADVILFQRECVKVLAEHFARKRQDALPAPQAVVPAETITQPAPVAQPASPPPGASLDEWRTWRQGMRAWLDWQDEMDRWRHDAARRQDELAQRQDAMEQRQDAVEDRVESAEEVIRLIPEILERLGPQTLTPEHQQSVCALVKRLHDVSGAAFASIYAELGEHFHVAKYGDIPDTAWPQVATWFQGRIAAAEQRQRA